LQQKKPENATHQAYAFIATQLKRSTVWMLAPFPQRLNWCILDADVA
jgi:hypothetical protein